MVVTIPYDDREACLIEDCGVEGLSANHDERDLFDDA